MKAGTPDFLPYVPASFNDTNIAVRLAIIAALPFVETPGLLVSVCQFCRIEPWHFLFFLAVQLVQTTLFHLAWRAVIYKQPQKPEIPLGNGEQPDLHGDVAKMQARTQLIPIYNPIRNLFLSFTAFIELSWLFATIYFNRFADCFSQPIGAFWDALYFSVVTGATVGFGDISPTACCSPLRLVVIFHILFSLTMVSVVVARALNAVTGFRAIGRN